MSFSFFKRIVIFFLFTIIFTCYQAVASNNRPPEIVEAGRDKPPYPELIDFENIQGWRLETTEGINAELSRTDERIVYGKYAAKIIIKNVLAFVKDKKR